MRTAAVLFMIFFVAVAAPTALAAPTLALSAEPGMYVPDNLLDVTVTVTSNIADDLDAIGFQLWIPDGVTLVGFINPPDASHFEPQGYAEGSWYNLGSPLNATLSLLVDPAASQDIVVTGQVLWFDDDDQQIQSGPFVRLTIPRFIEPARYHSADTGVSTGVPNWQIDISELLRVVQLYNTNGYHCDAEVEATEDGFVPGILGSRECDRHDGDYLDPAWKITVSELLRMIQFFNVGGYHYCPDDPQTEDGFCPGLGGLG